MNALFNDVRAWSGVEVEDADIKGGPLMRDELGATSSSDCPSHTDILPPLSSATCWGRY